MKVLVIGFTKISYMPYINFYIDQLKKLNCDISLLYWDRDSAPDIELQAINKFHCFKKNMQDSEPMIKKIPYFIKFRKYAKKIIRSDDFDFIIVLHSTPGVLLSDILRRKFRDRYILDYRDFTYENINIYKKRIHKLVDNSRMTFVSSKGYLKNLPTSEKIFISHNLLMHSRAERNVRKKLPREKEIIRIRFWGFIRHLEINKKIIDQLGNDCRFELHYHGREQEVGQLLRRYVEEKKIENIFFHGEYKPIERVEFASKTDLLHNVYDNDTKTTYAMGNKYYDGLTFYLPQLCNKDSFMGREVESSGIGIMLNPFESEYGDAIVEYYNNINWEKFNMNCDEKLDEIFEEYNDGMDILRKTVLR